MSDEHEIEGNEPETVEALPVCDRCRHRPARSFAPDGSMTCESCRLVEELLARSGSLSAITWGPGGQRVIEAPSAATEAGDPDEWQEGLTVSQLLAMHGYTTHKAVIGADVNAGEDCQQIGIENFDGADRSWVWQDAVGVHWGFHKVSGWVAWGTSLVHPGGPAVAPFSPAYRRTDTEVEELQLDDPVNHPSHYTSSPARCPECGHGIECIDITRHMGFNLGNTVKYVWRCDLKNDAIEDLEKAVFYLQDEIKERKRKHDSETQETGK